MHARLAKLRAWLLGWRGVACLAAGAALVWLAAAGLPDGRLHVYFLDVGQGDAVFIRAPDGRQILVDGGPSPSALFDQLGRVMPFWDRSLDLVVLTHADGDHLNGLAALPSRYRIGHVLQPALPAADPTAAAWQEQLAAQTVPQTVATRGLQVRAGQATLTVLNPGPAPLAGTPADDNNNSVVLRLDYGASGFLLTGDAEQEAEAAMLAAALPLQADVLKVGHHGSNRSTSAAFLAAVAPRLAVIPVGADNRFGHPHPDLLARLAGVRVLRTDQAGCIQTVSDGRQIWTESCGY